MDCMAVSPPMDSCGPNVDDHLGGPPQNGRCSSSVRGSQHHAAHAAAPLGSSEATLGRHLARRLVEIGVGDVFSVPGDFNLTLLDHLIAEPGLNNVGCCNELNAGYAADGYARARGVGACVVTFTVGGLSILNAIAGAYSENLPIICIVGGPNTNDYGTSRILHHTIGLPDFSQELRCFQTVTCYQVVTETSVQVLNIQLQIFIASAFDLLIDVDECGYMIISFHLGKKEAFCRSKLEQSRTPF